ncbi:MAG: hypothetical protein IPM45_03650 [Acidimicrobiales bacterium]|nr:hypothetical protein [Acidimicrobiales bacterium]
MHRRTPRLILAALVVLVATASLTACGGGGGGGDDDEQTTTTAEATTTSSTEPTTTTTAPTTEEGAIEAAIRDTAVADVRDVPAGYFTVEGITIVEVSGAQYATARLVSTPEAAAQFQDAVAVLEKAPTGWIVADVGTAFVGCGIVPPDALAALGLPSECPPPATSSTTAPTTTVAPPPEVDDQEAMCTAYTALVQSELQRTATAGGSSGAIDDANEQRSQAIDDLRQELGDPLPPEIDDALQTLDDNPIQASDADGTPEAVKDALQTITGWLSPVCT